MSSDNEKQKSSVGVGDEDEVKQRSDELTIKQQEVIDKEVIYFILLVLYI